MSELVETAEKALQSRLLELEIERKRLEGALRALVDSDGQGRRQSRTRRGRTRAAAKPGRGAAAKTSRTVRGSTGRARAPEAKSHRRSSTARGGNVDRKQAEAVAAYLEKHPKASTDEIKRELRLTDGRIVGAQKRRLAAANQ